jgi:small subunit ribosomal protein S16
LERPLAWVAGSGGARPEGSQWEGKGGVESLIAVQCSRRLQWMGLRRRDLVLTIRLSRIGKKKKPFYRVVVIERTRPRDGRVRELVGTYDPLKKPAEIKLDAERIKYWLGVGAQPSDTVRSFLKLQKIA